MDNIKTFTVDELIAELQTVAADTPHGGSTKVAIGDWEGNIGAFGPVETLEVAYDDECDRVTIFCDPHERLYPNGFGERDCQF